MFITVQCLPDIEINFWDQNKPKLVETAIVYNLAITIYDRHCIDPIKAP